MSRFMSKRLSELEAYTPGEQPQDRSYIKLNTNESPYPPSDGVVRAIDRAQIEKLRLYPDPTSGALKAAMAECMGVTEDCVFLANGSDDVLNFAFMAFGEGGVGFCDITYGFYEVFAALHGLHARVIPLKEDFSVDLAAFMDYPGMVALANPNAPTGLALSRDEVEQLLRANADRVVLIDEAYVDFGAESCVELVKTYDNLLCVGTFSKSRSMAGARLGFAIACPALIADLEKIKYSTNPYNLDRLTQAAGVAALKEQAYYSANCQKIIETREYVAAKLREIGFTVIPSSANFLFAKSDKLSGKQVYQGLKEKGVLVRHFEKPRIGEYNRITIGSREEMECFLEAIKQLLGVRS